MPPLRPAFASTQQTMVCVLYTMITGIISDISKRLLCVIDAVILITEKRFISGVF